MIGQEPSGADVALWSVDSGAVLVTTEDVGRTWKVFDLYTSR